MCVCMKKRLIIGSLPVCHRWEHQHLRPIYANSECWLLNIGNQTSLGSRPPSPTRLRSHWAEIQKKGSNPDRDTQPASHIRTTFFFIPSILPFIVSLRLRVRELSHTKKEKLSCPPRVVLPLSALFPRCSFSSFFPPSHIHIHVPNRRHPFCSGI